MVGLPITVNRSYDSRQSRESQDFGHGWSIDLQDVEVDETRAPGQGWALNQYVSGSFGLIPEFCVALVGDAKVSVTLPDGEVKTFTPRAEPECNPLPILDVTIVFDSDSDTTSKLSALNDNVGRLNSASGIIGDITSDQPADPSRYQLTTKAGHVYTLSK